jgi:hypothetical protein
MENDSPPSLAMVSKLLKVNGYAERLEKLLAEYPLLVAMPYIAGNREAARKMIKVYEDPELARLAFHQIYSKYFTADETLDLIAFYKTPVGKKFVSFDELIRNQLNEMAIKLAVDIAVQIVQAQGRNESNDSDFTG